MVKEIERERDYPIKKSNEMVQKLMFMLSAQEFDILQFLIMKVKDDDFEFKPIEFSVKEYCRVANIEWSGGNYEDVKASLKNLRDKSAWVETLDGKGAALVAWIDAPVYFHYGTGTITVQLSSFWKPYLLQLKSRYTTTTLRELLPMKSVYGKRMYELLTSYMMNDKDSVRVEFTVEQLKKILLGQNWDKLYQKFSNFHTKVLKPALRDMEQYGNLDVEMTLQRYGRSYKYIYFDVKTKPSDRRYDAAFAAAEHFGEVVV